MATMLRWCVALLLHRRRADVASRAGRRRCAAGAAPAGLRIAGALIGALSALVGIGGGSMTVPLLVWRGVTPVRAVGTSSACGIFIGIGSALGYALQAPAGHCRWPGAGYVYLPAALGVAPRLQCWRRRAAPPTHSVSGLALKRVFALFMLLVGSSFAWSALR